MNEDNPIAWIVGGVVGLIVVLWLAVGLTYGDLTLYKVFAPKYEQARTEVWQNTQSRADGMAADLGQMKNAWFLTKDDNAKAAIESTVRQRTNSYDTSKLPEDLREWVAKCRNHEFKHGN